MTGSTENTFVIMGDFESEAGFELYRDNVTHCKIRDEDIIPYVESRTSTQIWIEK